MNPNTTDTDTDTVREILAHSGQYTITEVIEHNALQHQFDVYELIIRGHTAVAVAETPHENTDTVEHVSVSFAGDSAVQDIGVELLRASHIVIPLQGVQVLETVTETQYTDSRWIENPLNHTPAFQYQPVTYPSGPAATADTPNGLHDDTDDDDGAIPVVK